MGLQQSDITDLNYDLVMGLTAGNINAILKQYYAHGYLYMQFQEQVCYYGNGSMPLMRDQFITATGGIDPFDIPSWNGQGTRPANIQTCLNNNFFFAFKFTPGDPNGFPAWDYSYIPKINPAENLFGTPMVDMTLSCYDFQIVYWDPINNVWVNVTQTPPAVTSIVKMVASVPLVHLSIPYNPSDNTTPAAVKAQASALQAKNISFNVQQLLLGFDQAMPGPASMIPGQKVQNIVNTNILYAFIQTYGQAVESAVLPLTYSIQQTNPQDHSSVTLTDVQYFQQAVVDGTGAPVSNPTPSQTALNTLNYFCSTNGDTPVAPQQLAWNWFDTTPDASGAMAMSKYVLGKLFQDQLTAYVEKNCWIPQVSCANNSGTDQWSFSMAQNGNLSFDPVMKGNSNEYFLIYLYSDSTGKICGVNNPDDYVQIETNFQLEVSISGPDSILVTQLITFDYTVDIDKNYAAGQPFNNTYTDTYTVVVGADGTMGFTISSNVPSTPDPVKLVPGLSSSEAAQLQQAIESSVAAISATSLSALPLGTVQDVFFPGGTVFTFKDAQFSANHDLVCEITYNAMG
jgi:hypothetical protein